MVANINLIQQESYSFVNLEKQLMSNELPKQTLLNQFSLCPERSPHNFPKA
ncbi:hypothetical protein HEO91_020945 [Escherichia coli]|nr:hypothetical protein [Escherichia coli]